MFRARIRGIYATALTKLALDWGFKVVQPTPQIAERFGLRPDPSPPDVTVKDHESKTGVVAIGDCPAVDHLLERLREYADPVVAKASAGLHDVFVGRVVGEGLVEGPGGLMEVPGRYVLQPGAASVFTVVKPPVGPLRGVAVPEIVVDGKLLELNTTGRVAYSRHIGEEERLRLRILAETRLKAYASIGLRFKSSAKYAGEEELAREAEELYRELLRLSQGGPPGALLRRGRCLAVVLFDKRAKFKLDEARAAVVPTVRGHHALRGQGLGRCLDLLDHVGADVYERAAAFLARGRVAIYHVKPWGEVVKMRGEVVKALEDVLVVKRTLKPGGVLDGIGARIEPGTYALTCVPRSGGYVVHSYYSASGVYLGTYVNANTEPEWGRRVVYIDLLVDKAYGPDGVERVLDEEELQRYAHMLPERLRRPEAPGGKICTPEGLTSAPPRSSSA
ncbi:DUF402 domain-containing protein [Pyrobaculum neutrophilum]|uniref:Probable ribonuclease FAU-1 n=1 Tax=Pyrobaculum neutrophilum (strain DSM 2338 / JCM 9278 / NBRC 100436 / V24Sta) TaxID=444157 RepID=FAU1_PYRNV|nr:DUF402 domain-containing protein [Pyrobaculum neutrophilum]B1YDP2.1 RecName: Full=Probable ribonuclease FAU-1; AltName: Full=RNA-binding protein FAU-1 [Pyrobaculum neutrophilum V24Sta]ACB39905.1 protein of unknown function DUF402 [Pyrobaculum neutrophilum V24Sta]